MHVFATICLSLCLASALAMRTPPKNSKYTVVQLNEIVRHGARTTYESVLNTDLTKLLGKSELTPNGMIMHYVLGRELREIYPQIFNGPAQEKEVNIYVSPVARCIQSAVSELFGLYPDGSSDIATNFEGIQPSFTNIRANASNTGSGLQYQYGPLKLKIDNPSTNLVFSSYIDAVCPKAVQHRAEMFAKIIPKYDYLAVSLSDELKAAGFDPQTLVKSEHFSLEQLTNIYDEIEGYINYYGRLVDGITKDTHAKLYRVANLFYTLWYGDDNFMRLVTHRMAKNLLNRIEEHVEGGENKFNLWTGHNTNIHAFSILLGLTNAKCMEQAASTGSQPEACIVTPGYASSYIFELNKKGNDFYVRTLLDGKPVKICPKNEDEFYCSWSLFKNQWSQKLFFNDGNIAEFCGNPNIDDDGQPKESQGVTLYMCYILIALIALSSIETLRSNIIPRIFKSSKNSSSFTKLEETSIGADNMD